MIALGTGNKSAALHIRRNDLYETPPEAVEALLREEHLPHCIWEPACGRGAIVNVLRRHGHKVFASDLVDYGLEDSEARVDFLMETIAPNDVELILTNPPFKFVNKFVDHALHLCPRVIMLAPIGFLAGQRRRDILESGAFARSYVFRNRLPMMHRDGYTGPRATSAMNFAWFCWDRQHAGPAELRWVSWTRLSLPDGSAGKVAGR
jgi:hypothetical protein